MTSRYSPKYWLTMSFHSRPVLDVRDVLQVEHMVSLVPEEPRDDIERDVRLRVAHVGLVLRGEAADEHGYAVRLEGNELLFRPRQRVVHSDGHRAVRIWAAGIKVLEDPTRRAEHRSV